MNQIKRTLFNMLQELLNVEDEVDETLGFFDMGLSSLTVFTFCEHIGEQLEVKCDDTDIFNYPNIRELSNYIYDIKNKA